MVKQFNGNFHSKTLNYREIKYIFMDVKRCFNASLGLKGLRHCYWERDLCLYTKIYKIFALKLNKCEYFSSTLSDKWGEILIIEFSSLRVKVLIIGRDLCVSA